jgi:predicted ribosomally synthesized peptide with nif11-like leader
MSLENVKAFYQRLASDELFRTQIQSVNSKAECSQIVKGAGYDFTQEEYEEYTAQLLESGATDGELRELDEKELEAVFGGAFSLNQAMIYGVVWPNDGYPANKPLVIRPLYGVVSPD